MTALWAAAGVVYAAGWLLAARRAYRRLLARHEAVWEQHAKAVRAGNRIGYGDCEEKFCQFTPHLGPYSDARSLPAVAMGAALAWPLLGVVWAVTWQRPTRESTAEAITRLERELDGAP